ncbi:ABC transporter permease [Ketogulonicigenium vulgare]|uniref:ABC transporter permease n=1 Tax=Ketogulonicigenium vulgare TaxID=92945 RepID=UPI0001E677B3|nr:ABC transporter permease [Ketogulonicigenium vulgare]ADO41455.1 putative peptide ABC transporter, permease protein [Ketogulonicigenium vulgare Y25]ALJ79935.1 peptide ABC transporter permease [Ketogulonicigenium vulgare]AOZ53390.1 peptide ABC transporter permease [Ketogulonicigenium vulgare]
MAVFKKLWENKKVLVGLSIVAALVLMAIFAPLLTEYSPTRRVGRPHEPPSWDHIMGTTRLGHDVFTRFLYGARTSLMVGFGAGLLITIIGTTLGIIAGYKGGVVDEVINFFTNMVLVVPNLPLLLVLAAFIGQVSPLVIALILGFTSWAWGVRVTRAQTMSIRERDFVKSAEMLGEPQWRIMLFEIFPNLISIVGINFIGSVIFAVITEATLEFLGLGNPNTVSWGIMLYNAQNASALVVGAWWDLLAPCFGLAVLGLGLALINFAIDEMANPRLRTGTILGRWFGLIRSGEGKL